MKNLFSKKYGSLYYRLSYFFKYKLPFSKHWHERHNPLYYWWKARKYFKRPNINFRKGKILWFFGFPIRKEYINPIIDIRFKALGWKDKYNTPRHEWDPYISIVFFRKYQLLWVFSYDNWVKNIATWEAILDYLYYNKSIEECKQDHVWSKLTIIDNLK